MKTIQGWTINGWTVGREDNVWTATRKGRTIKADSFSDLIIKIDQAETPLQRALRLSRENSAYGSFGRPKE